MLLTTVADLDTAKRDYHAKASGITKDLKAGIAAVFSPGITSTQDFHSRVQSMSVTVGGKDVPPPYATAAGDITQPALQVVWRLLLTLTLQWNTRRNTVSAKGRRGALEANLDTVLAFLGPALEVASASGPSKTKPVAGELVDVRKLLMKPQQAPERRA